jgi:transposase-like protein
MGRQRKDRELHWRGVLHRQAESGLSVARFCRQESISAPSFYSWRRKLEERDAAACPVNHQADDETISATQLLPVRIESSNQPASVRILLPQGVAIDAPSRIEPGALTDLLRVLREAFLC